MHDTTIGVIDMQVALPPDKSHVIMIWVDGLVLPTQGGFAQIPTGRYQGLMPKELAIRIRDELTEAIEQVEDPKPRVETASSMAEADRVARQEAAVRSLRDGVR